MSVYNVTQIFAPPGFWGLTLNSCPDTFSFWFVAISPTLNALGPGHSGSPFIGGVSGTFVSGTSGGVTTGTCSGIVINNCSGSKFIAV